jgi:DNA-binding NarL/FixJ family response regulator
MNDIVSVAVIDEQPLFRRGIVLTVERAEKFTLAGEGSCLADALRIVRREKPRLMLLDVGSPADTAAAVRAVLREAPHLKVIVLTAFDDAGHVTQVLNGGVSAYVLKGVTGSELIRIMDAVCRGERFVSPDLAWRLLVEPRKEAHPPITTDVPLSNLSQREREVLGHSCQGLTNPEIASRLGVSVRTVKYYKTLLFGKMRVRNRIEAMVMAQSMHIT